MGWDISYHPVGKDEIQSIYFKGLADPEYYKELVKQFEVNDFYAECLRDRFEEARQLTGDINLNEGHVFYIAMIFGFLRKYQYIRGGAMSFLVGDPLFDGFFSDWRKLVPEAYRNIDCDNCLTENYSGGVYLSYESLKQLRESYESDSEVREKMNDIFSHGRLDIFWKAVEDAIESGLGLVEASEIITPNPVDLNTSKCYSNLFNCDPAGAFLYAEAANQQIAIAFAESQFDDAMKYYDDGNVEKAIELLTKSAQQGHVLAQFNLALFYEKGVGVAQNDEIALQWYQKAADAGDEKAKKKVAEFTEKGIIIEEAKSTQTKREISPKFAENNSGNQTSTTSVTITDHEFKKILTASLAKMNIGVVLITAFGVFLVWLLVDNDPKAMDGVNLAGKIFLWVLALLTVYISFSSLYTNIKNYLEIKWGKHPLLKALANQDSNYVSWFYLAVTKVKGIKTVHEIVMHSRDGKRLALISTIDKDEAILNYLREKFPQAMEGNTKEYAQRYKTSLSGGDGKTATTKYDSYVILPGIGLQECSLGMHENDFQRLFGGKKEGNYITARDKGIDAFIDQKHKKIMTLFFYFHPKMSTSFPGVTDKGINGESSIEDVIKQYGKPEHMGESVVSEYGAMPGAQEQSLEYKSQGITFTFWDGHLADIRIYAKR